MDIEEKGWKRAILYHLTKLTWWITKIFTSLLRSRSNQINPRRWEKEKFLWLRTTLCEYEIQNAANCRGRRSRYSIVMEDAIAQQVRFLLSFQDSSSQSLKINDWVVT